MDNVSLFSEAKSEYMKQLCSWIVPPLVEFFMREYTSLAASKGRGAMAAFQTFCSEVPRWNQDIIDSNIGQILDNCRCDYVDELMTAVFIAHTKMLTSIRVSSKQKKLQITLPKLDHFLHRVFVECARAFWKAPFLFDTSLSPIEAQKNVLQAEAMCTDALGAAIRSLLPVKNILRDYLDDDEESGGAGLRRGTTTSVAEEDSSSDDEEDTAPKKPTGKKSAAKSAPEPSLSSFTVQKLDTPMKDPEPPSVSAHEAEMPSSSTSNIVTLTKESDLPNPNPPKLMIETEPSVHFTPYDTVFGENSAGEKESEIRYSPKISVEDKPPSNWGLEEAEDEDAPRLTLSDSVESIGLDDIEDLEPPVTAPVPIPVPVPVDIDAPLGTTGDFETLE